MQGDSLALLDDLSSRGRLGPYRRLMRSTVKVEHNNVDGNNVYSTTELNIFIIVYKQSGPQKMVTITDKHLRYYRYVLPSRRGTDALQ